MSRPIFMEPNDGMVNRRHFTMKSTTEQPFESNRTSLTNLKNLEMLRFKPASLNSWNSASEPEVFLPPASTIWGRYCCHRNLSVGGRGTSNASWDR